MTLIAKKLISEYLSVEIHHVPCIVTQPPVRNTTLVVPGNQQLNGTKVNKNDIKFFLIFRSPTFREVAFFIVVSKF